MNESDFDDFLDGQVVAGTGANVNVSIPKGTTAVWICARGGDVYATPNGIAGPLTSPFHAADGTVRIAGPFKNMTHIGIYAATNVYAHLAFVG